MLDKTGTRQLAYLVKVDEITPMNADKLECAHIGGWHCVVGKGEFKVGDPAVYFEIDSQLPDVWPFSSMEFLKSKDFKIKTQKIRGEYSQGLLMPVSAWDWTFSEDEQGLFVLTNVELPVDPGRVLRLDDESRFLTQRLGVTYATPEDNTRKASSTDKYKKMAQRHPKLFQKPLFRWLMKRTWGKKLLFVFFGKKRDKKSDWPYWVVKTDEERIQNCGFMLNLDTKWIATEKIDGSSTTFTLYGDKFLVCSRNVVFNAPSKEDKCFYDTNIYTEMAEKYCMRDKMKEALKDVHNYIGKEIKFITIQAETYGSGVQKRDYGLKEHDMAIFNVIFGYADGHTERLNPIEGKEFADKYQLPYVPVISEAMTLPTVVEDVVAMADGKSKIDGGMREGIVFRSIDGTKSFKSVSNEFLIKYHG